MTTWSIVVVGQLDGRITHRPSIITIDSKYMGYKYVSKPKTNTLQFVFKFDVIILVDNKYYTLI